MRLFLILLVLTLWPAAAHAQKLKVVASFSILGDMVRQVAGDDISLVTLVKANGDPHVYEPTPADVAALSGAGLVVVNGLGFEGWLPRLIQSSGYKGPVAVATAGITPIALGPMHDPHAWQSLSNARIYVRNIRDALAKADPAHAAAYRENAARYDSQLAALDIWAKSQFASVPTGRRKAITSHDSFNYLARDYGVTLIAPLGISTESEPSAAGMARLIDQMRGQKIRVLFLENMSDPRLISELQTEGRATIGGTLYSDALSGPDGPAKNFIALFRYNVGTLVAAMKKNSAPD